jgi:fucose permease
MESGTPSEESLLLDDLDCDTHDVARRNHIPRHISLRIGAAMYSFVILGLFQSSVGVMLQPLSQWYSLGDLYVSFIFVVGPVGYVIAAQFSDTVHRKYGQRGVAIFAPALHISGALVIATHPPFGIVLVAHATVALGLGLLDVSWCAWAASLENANLVSGLLQGAFSVGAAAGPFFASTVLPLYSRPWYDWYYILVSLEMQNKYHSSSIDVARPPPLS